MFRGIHIKTFCSIQKKTSRCCIPSFSFLVPSLFSLYFFFLSLILPLSRTTTTTTTIRRTRIFFQPSNNFASTHEKNAFDIEHKWPHLFPSWLASLHLSPSLSFPFSSSFSFAFTLFFLVTQDIKVCMPPLLPLNFACLSLCCCCCVHIRPSPNSLRRESRQVCFRFLFPCISFTNTSILYSCCCFCYVVMHKII